MTEKLNYGFRYDPSRWAEDIHVAEDDSGPGDSAGYSRATRPLPLTAPRRSKAPALGNKARKLAGEVANTKLAGGCPWGDADKVRELWGLRQHADVEAALEHGLKTMLDAVQEGKGWPVYLDPGGFVRCAAEIDHPLARAILIKQLPLILRAQIEDGSWRVHELSSLSTDTVLTALMRHGLFEPLHQAPPLPPDWQIVRSVPTPRGDLRTMTWDGDRLWVYNRAGGEAMALSPSTGRALSRVAMPPGTSGITWHNGRLLAMNGEARTIQAIDPGTGEAESVTPVAIPWGELSAFTSFGGGLCVGHWQRASAHFIGCSIPFHDDPETAMTLGGTGAVDMTADKKSVWYIDLLSPAIVRSDPHADGRIIDWGEKPFGEDTTGIAHDGKNLWVLDNRNKRICVVERSTNE